MKKNMLIITIVSLLTITMSGCFSTKYNISMYPIYESESEIYLELNVHEYEPTYNYVYKIAVLDKDSGEFNILDDIEYYKESPISNYAAHSKGTDYFNVIELNNPIFYDNNNEQFIDIRDNEVIELNEECSSIVSYIDTCNVLDNDFQVVLDNHGNNTYNLLISNYILKEQLNSYSFSLDNNQPDLIPQITTYNKYDKNKIGIRINFYSSSLLVSQNDSIVTSVVFEYLIDTNTITTLFEGIEYEAFDFYMIDDSYIFAVNDHLSDSNKLYKYDTLTNSFTYYQLNYFPEYLNYGYWYGVFPQGISKLFSYYSDIKVNEIDWYNGYTDVSYAFSNDLCFDDGFIPNHTSWGGYSYYRIININTQEVILEVASNDSDFAKGLLSD